MALLPERDHYGLVWTMTPARGRSDARARRTSVPRRRSRRASARASRGFARVAARRTFPLALERARPIVSRALRRRSATRRRQLHPVAGPGLQPRACAMRGSSRRSILDTPRDALGAPAMLARHAAAAQPRPRGGHRVHAWPAARCSATIMPRSRWPRGLALALLDAMPPREARVHARDAVRRVAETRRSHLHRACPTRRTSAHFRAH